MKLFTPIERAEITHEIGAAADVDLATAADMYDNFVAYGPASPHCETVLPIVWGHVASIARAAARTIDATLEAMAEDVVAEVHGLAVDIEVARVWAEHPDLRE